MAGLNLIKTYSSDSEEEDNKCDDVDTMERRDDAVKMANRLALPESISSWKGVVDEQVTDVPSNHDGRTRSFEHERGNWATLIYINYTASDGLSAWIDSTLSKFAIHGNLVPSLHISLSRTLVLKFHWIESFAESLKLLCQRFDRFVVWFTDVRAYCNEERTRTFLGIHCRNDDGTLQRFTTALDALLAEYRLPSFYEDTSYHVSFFSCLGDEREHLRKLLPFLSNSFNQFLAENASDSCVRVDEIQCKIGNKYYTFRLR